MSRRRIGAWAGAIAIAVLPARGTAAQEPRDTAAAAITFGLEPRSVTLAEAIELARRVQPSIIQATGEVRTAQAGVRSAWGAYLPSLNLSANGSESYSGIPSRVDPVTGQVIGSRSNGSIGTSVSASIDLFTGFRRGAESNAARARREAALAGLVDARYQQQLTTTNQFLDALAAAALVRVREASLRRAEEQLRASAARLAAGAATRSDTLRSRVAVGTAELNLARTRSDLAAAEAGLARLIGLPGRVRAADDSTLYTIIDIDTSAIRAEALRRSPRVQTTSAAAAAAKAGVHAARAAYWPTLTLGGSAGLNGSRTEDYTLRSNAQLSLQLSWRLFDRFDRETRIVQQETAADVAEAEAADAVRQVDAAVTTELAALETARRSLEIAQTSLVAATEDLRVQQERYRVGLATIVDVLTSQESLDQAEVDVVTARFEYLRAKARLEALLGRSL